MLTIKYQVMDLDGQVECLPMQILPERISLQDYDINFNSSSKKIESVTNKTYGQVEFKAVELS